jgi:hypothetical protein
MVTKITITIITNVILVASENPSSIQIIQTLSILGFGNEVFRFLLLASSLLILSIFSILVVRETNTPRKYYMGFVVIGSFIIGIILFLIGFFFLKDYASVLGYCGIIQFILVIIIANIEFLFYLGKLSSKKSTFSEI